MADKRYFELNDGIYILAYGRGGHTGKDISKTRYNKILNAVSKMPPDTETLTYRLKVDLTYEEFPIDPVEEGDIE